MATKKSVATETSSVLSELRLLADVAVPMMFRLTLLTGTDRAAIALVGHYDPSPPHMGGAALGKMYSNCVGLSIGIGVSMGLGTYCSQNHGRGADDENGVVLRQCFKALALAFAFSAPMTLFADRILTALSQPAELVEPCHRFATVLLVGLPGTWASSAIGSVLTAQKNPLPSMVSDSVAALVQLLLSAHFLASGVGFCGVAVATTVSNYVSLALVLGYVLLWRKQAMVWQIPARVSERGQVSFAAFLALSLPAGFSLWAEWWAAELFQILAGLLPNGAIAASANGVLFSTLAVFYMTFVSVQIAVSVRVGNLVGEEAPSKIPMAVRVNLASACVLSCLVTAALWLGGRAILALFTSDARILAEAVGANAGMALSIPPYATMMCLVGVLRAAGLTVSPTLALSVAFYLIGLPIGAFLGLHTSRGLLGLWLGNVISLTVASVLLAGLVLRVDWTEICAGHKSTLVEPLLA